MVQSTQISQNIRPRVTARPSVVGRIRVSGLLSVSETDFARLIEELEKDPFFGVLSRARLGGERLLSYSPAPRTSLSPRFYEELRPEIPANESFDVEGFLRRRESVLGLIRKMGRNRFEEHFLYARSGKTLAEAARECGLSPEEGGSVSQFLLEFSSRAEFFHASSLSIDPPHCMTLVGQIIKGRELSVAFFSPHLARGRYRVNETAIKSWLRDQFPKRSQGLQARKLLEKVRLINIRHSAFFRILSKAVDSQKNYLDTRDERRLEPVSAQDVARALDLSPSTVSRVIAGKSFLLPWGVETPISALLPGRHQVLLIAVEKVLEKAAHSLTDAQLTAVVRKDFHLKVSRRSINACRHELKGLQHE